MKEKEGATTNTVNNQAVMSNRMCRSMGVDENKVAKMQFQGRRMLKAADAGG